MVPAAVVVQTMDELYGIGVAEISGMEQHDVGFVFVGIREIRQEIGIVDAQIVRHAQDEQTLGVVVFIRERRVIS